MIALIRRSAGDGRVVGLGRLGRGDEAERLRGGRGGHEGDGAVGVVGHLGPVLEAPTGVLARRAQGDADRLGLARRELGDVGDDLPPQDVEPARHQVLDLDVLGGDQAGVLHGDREGHGVAVALLRPEAVLVQRQLGRHRNDHLRRDRGRRRGGLRLGLGLRRGRGHDAGAGALGGQGHGDDLAGRDALDRQVELGRAGGQAGLRRGDRGLALDGLADEHRGGRPGLADHKEKLVGVLGVRVALQDVRGVPQPGAGVADRGGLTPGGAGGGDRRDDGGADDGGGRQTRERAATATDGADGDGGHRGLAFVVVWACPLLVPEYW